MPSYNVFAEFYDAAMGDMSDKVRFLKTLIRDRVPDAQSVLELACGTGIITKELSGSYEVAGLDLSPEMIKKAKAKLPKADLRVGDMASFDFGKTFDVILCVFDSINHLEKWEDWQKTFENAHEHLNENGVFIFDINTSKRLEWLAEAPPFGRRLGDNYMIMDIQKEDDRFNWDVKVFQKDADGRYTLHQDNIYEVSFPIDQIEAELSNIFKVEDVLDVRNLDKDNPQWRPFFVCRKA